MNRLSKVIWALSASSLLLGGTQTVVNANSWQPRSAADVQAVIQYSSEHDHYYYEVQWGDTLSTIAEAAGLSTQEIAALNVIDNPDCIHEGAILYFNPADHTVSYYEENYDTITVSTNTGSIIEEDYTETIEELINEEPAIELDVEPQEAWVDLSPAAEESTETDWTVADQSELLVEADEFDQPMVEEEELETEPTIVESEIEDEAEVEELPLETIGADEIEASEWIDEAQADETLEEELPVQEAWNADSVEEFSQETDWVEDPVDDQPEASVESETFGRAIEVEATAYSRHEAGLSDYTADGTDLSMMSNVIAVDPSVIPLGSTVYIPGYGEFVAADTGGAIVGNRIDVHLEDVNSLQSFGRQMMTIYVLD